MASNTDDTPFRLSQSEYWLQLHTELSNSKSLNSDEIECVLSTIEEVLSSVDFQSNPILDSIILVSVMCFEIITKDEALHSDSSLQKYLYRIIVPLSKTTENAGYLVAEKFLCQALKLVSNDVVNLDVRLEILTVFNVIISNLTTTSRIHVWKSTELRASICNFGANLVNFGDFDLQAHAIALLLRLVPHAYRKRFASLHITGEQVELSAHFSRIDESSFELGIRNFLNSLNMSIIEDPKIVSLPCSSAFLCDTQLQCPAVRNGSAECLWLDFNMCTGRMSMYCSAPHDKVSGRMPQPSDDWELLTIYPDAIEFLDIDIIDDFVVLRFTMSEAIGEICEWAPNISGKTISINVKSSAVDPRFHGIIFTEDCSAGSPKYGLIRILQQLQSMFQFTPSSQHTGTPEAQSSREWQLAVPYHDGSRHTSVAISPILLNPRNSGSTSNLSPIPASFGSTILHPYRHAKELTREVIACSPLLCQPANYTGHQRSPDLLATSPALPLDTSVVSTSPSGSLSRKEKQVIQLDHMTNKTATPGTPVRDVDLDRQSLGLTPAQHQLDAGVESAYHASPEKQREATRDETVVLPLPVIQPMVKELLESPSSPATELSFHKQQPTPKSSTPSGEIADSPSASRVSDTEHPWTSLQLHEVCVVLTPITRPQGISPVTEAVSVRHPSTRWKDLEAGEHKDMDAFVPPTKEVLVSVGEAPASTPPVDATQLSSSSDATPIALGILKALNSTLLPGVHHSEASTKTTRKLCDLSTSYLIDTSPANADFPFTPDKPSIFALPELSAEVHFPKRARPNTSAAKRPLNRKSSTGFREESAVESGAHKGKVIERNQPRTSTFHVIRTAITEAADEPITEETVLDLGKQALTETSPTPIGIPPLPSVDTEELAAFPTSRDRTSSFERNANVDVPKPGFSLPKRRFFKSYRSERIARENERFEAARMIKITKRPDSKKRTTGGGQEALRISKPRAARGRLNKRAPPPIAAALADAMIPPTPSRDSDPDLLIEIVDSQDPQNAHVQNVVVPAAHPILETLIESSQCDDIIPASWNSSADNQIKSKDVTNQLQEEFNWPDDEVLVSSRPPSTPASLFAPTPSPAPARLRRNRKPPAKRPAKKAPLEFHTNQPSFHESQQPLQEPLDAVELEHIDPTDINLPTPGFATVLRRSSLVCEHVHQSLVVIVTCPEGNCFAEDRRQRFARILLRIRSISSVISCLLVVSFFFHRIQFARSHNVFLRFSTFVTFLCVQNNLFLPLSFVCSSCGVAFPPYTSLNHGLMHTLFCGDKELKICTGFSRHPLSPQGR